MCRFSATSSRFDVGEVRARLESKTYLHSGLEVVFADSGDR